MLKKWLILIWFIAFCNISNAQERKFSDYISKLWLVGKKQEVLYIANQRLLKDTNDLSALLIKMDYEISFSQFNDFSNTINQLSIVSHRIKTPKFNELLSSHLARIEILEQAVAKITPQMIAEESHKAYITNKLLPSLRFIQALEADGLVAPISEKEMELPDFPEQAARIKEVNEARAQAKKNKATNLETNKTSSTQPTNLIQPKTNQATEEQVIVPEKPKENADWLKWVLVGLGLAIAVGVMKLLNRKRFQDDDDFDSRE